MPLNDHVRSEWIEVDTAAGPMRSYLAATSDAPRRAVVVLQEAFGVNAHVQSIANRLAGAGYLALAPDLFHREVEPLVDYDDRERAMSLIGGLDADAITVDVGAAVAAARDLAPGAACAVVGFCFGGRAAFTAACTLDGIDAAIVFYGPGVAAGAHAVLDRVDGIDARMLLFYGGEDPTISADDRAAIERSLDGAHVRHESVVYEDAGHAFFCDARPALYRPGPSLDAWQRMTALLDG